MLATKFSKRSRSISGNEPLTNEQIYAVAPSVFAAEKHESRSERYTYIPTIEVLNGLRKEGFEPFFVAQSRCRLESKEDFTKHMIRLRQTNEIARPEVNEIILINSHDGTSSYQMLAGMFRFVCMNGMVTGDTVEDIRVQHKGNIVHNVVEAAYQIVDEFDKADESMENMKAIDLNYEERHILAKASLALKYDEDKAPIPADNLLRVHRLEDVNAKSVWGNFNVIQENLIRGGLEGRSVSGRKQTTRPVNSIDTNVKLNRALWILADEMAKLKG